MQEVVSLAGTVTVHPVYVLFFVLQDLPVQLIHQRINGSVHIAVFGLGVNLTADHVERSFRHLANFFHLKGDLAITDVVKVAFKLFKFA
jgi:hypothetical protein